MKIILLLFVTFLSVNSALAQEASCSPGQTRLKIQTGLQFDMVWVGSETGTDKGTYKPFQMPVSETTICRWSQQVVHIQEAITHHWYKLNYRHGVLVELESLR